MKTTNKTTALRDALRVRPTERQWVTIVDIVAKSGKKVSDVVRRGLSLGLPWANEPTLGRRMRSMKKALLLIGYMVSDLRQVSTTIVHIWAAIPQPPDTSIETQVQMNNIYSLAIHMRDQMIESLEAIKAAHAQLTQYEALKPEDCEEICHYLDKVAAASESVDRKRRIGELVHLFRTLGGI